MKRKKAGLYDPYLDTLGGGEKHIVSVLEVLDKKGYDVTLFWDEDLSKELQERFSLQFSHLSFKKNIFRNETPFATKQNILAEYDIFFYVPDGSYFASAAKQTVVFCMVPDKQLYPQSLVAKLKTAPFTFIANSHYTQSWLSHWGISSEVLYPYLDDPYIHIDAESLYKKDIILSVGRFFGHLHTKQHPQVIESFKKLKKEHPSFEHYQLVLAGGVKDEDRTYFDELQQRVDGDESISLLPNIPFHRLFDLYKSSRFYWHFTGYGVDPEKHPEQVEHLGITPLEAMACGCLTMAYDAGGPRELIEHEKNGCLFKTEDELFSSMQTFHDNETKQYQMKLQAKRFIKQTFSRKQFEKRVTEVLF
jgi:glycosyltransferase involved in cell wall biosynthesis